MTQRNFLACRRGTIAVLTALTVVPLMLAMGLGIDVARGYLVKSQMSFALDAAGLAAGSVLSSDAQALTTGRAFFNANFPPGGSATLASYSQTINGNIVTTSASATLNTTFMGLGNIPTMTLAATSQVTRPRGLEVALVLDNTNSLEKYSVNGVTNMMALKQAAGELVLMLFGTTPTSNPQLRVGIVPYTASVNAGPLAPSLVKNAPPLTPTNAAGWTGCVIEPAATFSNNTSTAVAAQLDSAVTMVQYLWPSNSSNYPWTPANINMMPYYLGENMQGPNAACPGPVVPMVNSRAPLLASIGATIGSDGTAVATLNVGMEGWHGGTIGSLGVAWGYRMLSPNGPFVNFETVSQWNDPLWAKAVVLMTDGVNNINVQWYNGFGPYDPSLTVPLVDAEEEVVCDALRSNGVVIYSVFLNSNSTAGPAISYCAGTQAGAGDPGYFYNAQDQAGLAEAFNDIAGRLNNLRVSQ